MPEPINPATTGGRIRMLRTSRGWTQSDLARRVHATQPAVAHWESGRHMPGRQSQRLLADAFDVPRDYLDRTVAA